MKIKKEMQKLRYMPHGAVCHRFLHLFPFENRYFFFGGCVSARIWSVRRSIICFFK